MLFSLLRKITKCEVFDCERVLKEKAKAAMRAYDTNRDGLVRTKDDFFPRFFLKTPEVLDYLFIHKQISINSLNITDISFGSSKVTVALKT